MAANAKIHSVHCINVA